MEELTTMLTGLADTLGTTVEYLWPVLIKQAGVQILIITLTILIGTIIIIITGLYIRYVMRNWENIKQTDTEIVYVMIAALFGGLSFLLIMQIVFFSIPELITVYYNPEFWALQKILNKL